MAVVVIGAGYAGTMAANRLARKASVDVTVVNSRPEFVERVRLHEYVAGSGAATVPLSEMLDPHITLVVGAVDQIGDGSVLLDDGTHLGFDHLVYAAGGSIVEPAGTLAVGGLESAKQARSTLAALDDGAVVTVVGGGLTGIETAAEIADARPTLKVQLLSEDEAGASLSPRARARVQHKLGSLGVVLQRGRYVADEDTSDLTLWAIANQVSDLAERSGLAVDNHGRLLVDEFLRSTSDPRIIAVGDGAAVPNQRPSCQTALPQGAHGADNLVRELAGKEQKRYSMGYIGQNVSIGRRQGVIQSSRRDDTPTWLWFGGRPAAMYKEQFCRMACGAAKSARYVWLPAPR